MTRSPSLLDGFVNRLQDSQSPSFLLLKLRGLNSYPDGTFTDCSCQPSLDAHFPLLIAASLHQDHFRVADAPRNGTVIASLFVAALSVSAAVFLIVELYSPYGGLIEVSSAPLRAALSQLGN